MKPTTLKKTTSADTIRNFILLGITLVSIYWILTPDKAQLVNPVSLSDLKGVWTTPHPQYQDRFLQFSDATVAFGWGDAGAGAYAIDDFDSKLAENSALVFIRYVDRASTTYPLSFNYVGQNGGTIWMKNQEGVCWIRTSPEPIYDPAFK